MRLTHLKLAGFKSFVDPTTIHLHGQRVGVVGPNGCGKSNVMESVRWVLGESSAKEMRADAMDAVIFNGSGNRKPISRASVELIFDNSLGGASGEWSSFAEIAVKRVIEREKGSTYYINNTAVRRRDVADLFLGTGLGGRAYAIIGQNTISRIVEAKPEELRVFLEEAAGISKYKERRRETELRLRDTRENLVRVEDICRELAKQITKLESQAVVTQQYHALQAAYKLAEGQLWLIKKRDASHHWAKAKTQVEKLVNQLEAQMAALRQSELQVETARQSFYAASEAINTAQAAYYEANAEVSNLENQVKQNADARERMALQLQQLAASLERNASNSQALHMQLATSQAELASASIVAEQKSAALRVLTQTLPAKDATLKAALESANKSQQALNNANQRIQIEQNNVRYLTQTLSENTQRIQKLNLDLTLIKLPDNVLLDGAEQLVSETQTSIAAAEQALHKMREEETAQQANILALRNKQNEAQKAANVAEAEISSLEKMQQSLNAEGQLSHWLQSQGLSKHARLWQKIKIDANWSVALEAVLGTKLNALITDAQLNTRPPSALVLGFSGASKTQAAAKNGLTPLMDVIKEADLTLKPVLEDWLAGTYCLAAGDDEKAAINCLHLGQRLVNAEGDIFSHHSVTYHGENTHLSGVIARQQRLESLSAAMPALQQAFVGVQQALHLAESELAQARQSQQQLSNQLRASTNTLHQQQLELSRLQQTRQSAEERKKNFEADIAAVNAKQTQLNSDIAAKQQAQAKLTSQLTSLETIKNNELHLKQQAEAVYFALRDDISAAEKENQEASFNLKIINSNINELNNKINANNEEKTGFLHRKTEAEKVLELTPMETLKINLASAIDNKTSCETRLADARNQLATEEQTLQALEQTRLQNEQQLHPLRDTLEQSRLGEQEARLYFEQCSASLAENGLEEQALAEGLTEDTKASTLLNKSNRLQTEIEALGAVNLAAIQELATEAERKSYLDSQMLDLSQATETLEDAIKKIDRETRDKLMHTFNTVNTYFAELFSTLFAGGHAKLELLGDEILDTGMQVFAQPPGKKNTTIQLLSGGEKALTAIALVFALFKLNPAPFCLMDEVDAPLDDSNTERFCAMVKKMSERTQFMFVSHNKITMEMAQQLIGVTMQESGVSRVVDVDIDAAMQMQG